MGGPSMLHCKQMPTFSPLHLNIFSFKRLKFGAQIAPPRTQVALASCSGTVYVTSACPITCLSPTDTAHFKAKNSTRCSGEHCLFPQGNTSKGRNDSPLFWCKEQREASTVCVPLVTAGGITALQQPQGKGPWLYLSVCVALQFRPASKHTLLPSSNNAINKNSSNSLFSK